jgi:hypothetical protein
MSTRSLIAVPDGSSWRGRYCHWDGYPGHMVPTLNQVYRLTFGGTDLDAMVRVLTADHYGWSVLSTGEPAADGAGEFVPGVGRAYTDQPDEWFSAEDAPEDLEWAYVLTPAGITVWQGGDAWTHRGTVGWHESTA